LNRGATKFLLALILILHTLTLSAQEFKGPVTTDPLPYQDVEFPQWAHDMRRFEVIFFGSFPITYILSSFVFDMTALAGNGSNSGSSSASVKSQNDLKLLLISSVSISGVIAVADLIIGKVKKNRNRIPEESN